MPHVSVQQGLAYNSSRKGREKKGCSGGLQGTGQAGVECAYHARPAAPVGSEGFTDFMGPTAVDEINIAEKQRVEGQTRSYMQKASKLSRAVFARDSAAGKFVELTAPGGNPYAGQIIVSRVTKPHVYGYVTRYGVYRPIPDEETAQRMVLNGCTGSKVDIPLPDAASAGKGTAIDNLPGLLQQLVVGDPVPEGGIPCGLEGKNVQPLMNANAAELWQQSHSGTRRTVPLGYRDDETSLAKEGSPTFIGCATTAWDGKAGVLQEQEDLGSKVTEECFTRAVDTAASAYGVAPDATGPGGEPTGRCYTAHGAAKMVDLGAATRPIDPSIPSVPCSSLHQDGPGDTDFAWDDPSDPAYVGGSDVLGDSNVAPAYKGHAYRGDTMFWTTPSITPDAATQLGFGWTQDGRLVVANHKQLKITEEETRAGVLTVGSAVAPQILPDTYAANFDPFIQLNVSGAPMATSPLAMVPALTSASPVQLYGNLQLYLSNQGALSIVGGEGQLPSFGSWSDAGLPVETSDWIASPEWVNCGSSVSPGFLSLVVDAPLRIGDWLSSPNGNCRLMVRCLYDPPPANLAPGASPPPRTCRLALELQWRTSLCSPSTSLGAAERGWCAKNPDACKAATVGANAVVLRHAPAVPAWSEASNMLGVHVTGDMSAAQGNACKGGSKSSTFQTIPAGAASPGDAYVPVQGYDSPGHDIGTSTDMPGGQARDNVPLKACKAACTANPGCGGFVYEESSESCMPKTTGMFPAGLRVKAPGSTMYIRQLDAQLGEGCAVDMMAQTPQGAPMTIAGIAGFPYGGAASKDTKCNLAAATSCMTDVDPEADAAAAGMAKDVQRMGKKKARLTAELAYNEDRVDNDVYNFDQVAKASGVMSGSGLTMPRAQQEDSDLRMISENYTSLLWTIAAVVVVGIGVRAAGK